MLCPLRLCNFFVAKICVPSFQHLIPQSQRRVYSRKHVFRRHKIISCSTELRFPFAPVAPDHCSMLDKDILRSAVWCLYVKCPQHIIVEASMTVVMSMRMTLHWSSCISHSSTIAMQKFRIKDTTNEKELESDQSLKFSSVLWTEITHNEGSDYSETKGELSLFRSCVFIHLITTNFRQFIKHSLLLSIVLTISSNYHAIVLFRNKAN